MITKRGSLLAHLALPAGLHVLQNMATRFAMGSHKFHKHLANKAVGALRGDATVPLSGERVVAASRGIVPEIGMLSDELTGAMSKARNTLGKDQAKFVNNEEVAQLGQALQGKFTFLYDKDPAAFHGTMQDVAGILKQQGLPDIASNVGSLGRDAVLELEKLWSRNALTGKLLSGIGKQIESGGYQNVGKEISHAAAKKLNNVGDVAGMAAITIRDPVTGVVNAGKKALLSEHVTGPIGKARDWLNKKFMFDPVKGMHAKGVAGDEIKARGLRRFGDTYLLNPITADVKNLAYDIGRFQKKHIMKPPDVTP